MADFAYIEIPKLYTELQSNEKNVIQIFKDTNAEAKKIFKHIKQQTAIYNGEQECYIPNSNRRANEKNVVNYTKVLVDTCVSLLLHKPITYVSRVKEPEYQEDVDKINAYLIDEGENDLNVAIATDLLVNGVSFVYCFAQNKDNDVTPHSPFTLLRLDNTKTYAVYSTNIGNKVEVVFYINNYRDEDGNIVERIYAYDNKYVYKIVKGINDEDYRLEDFSLENPFDDTKKTALFLPHGLPNLPIIDFDSGVYRTSLVQDLWGLQKSLNSSMSSYTNDILLRVDQLLTIFGIELTEEAASQMRKNNILNSPNPDTKANFITSQLDNRTIEFIDGIIDKMHVIAGVPTQGRSRAETGEASKYENGHTLANFNSNRREQRFYIPKRKQLENIITILRGKGELKSNITSKDIEIKFDKNRLVSVSETVNNLKTLIETGIRPIDALNVSPLFDDNGSVAEGIEENIAKRKEFELELIRTKQSNKVVAQNIDESV